MLPKPTMAIISDDAVAGNAQRGRHGDQARQPGQRVLAARDGSRCGARRRSCTGMSSGASGGIAPDVDRGLRCVGGGMRGRVQLAVHRYSQVSVTGRLPLSRRSRSSATVASPGASSKLARTPRVRRIGLQIARC